MMKCSGHWYKEREFIESSRGRWDDAVVEAIWLCEMAGAKDALLFVTGDE
jgi:hypothetical protein